MLNIFHKLPSQAKKFLETQGGWVDGWGGNSATAARSMLPLPASLGLGRVQHALLR